MKKSRKGRNQELRGDHYLREIMTNEELNYHEVIQFCKEICGYLGVKGREQIMNCEGGQDCLKVEEGGRDGISPKKPFGPFFSETLLHIHPEGCQVNK